MKEYFSMSKEELAAEKEFLMNQYKEEQRKGLNLDLSRGKPSSDQLDISNDMMTNVSEESGFLTEAGEDTRNYGMGNGIPECKALFAELLGISAENVIIGGASSLSLMFDYITQCLISDKSGEGWLASGKPVKFLCPCPGYDRHFSILEYYGIEMINITMENDGPNIAEIEEAIKDEQVKGMFCVPKYSNPTGCTYSDEKVRAIAALKPSAGDFRIIWDNAYIIHDLADAEHADKLLNIFDLLPEYGNEDMLVEFCSTSKLSFSGAGVSALAASKNNIDAIARRMAVQIISHDKINQLRHTRFFGGLDGLKLQAEKHRKILFPKFKMVLDILEKYLAPCGFADWTKPNGGYFISLNVMEGTATRTVELCRQAGVTLTAAGSTFPYGIDPKDRNIRIAPSYPPEAELKICAEILAVSARLAAVENLLNK